MDNACRVDRETTLHDFKISARDKEGKIILEQAKKDTTYTSAKWLLVRKLLDLDFIQENIVAAFGQACYTRNQRGELVEDKLLMSKLPAAITQGYMETQSACMKKVLFELLQIAEHSAEAELEQNPWMIEEVLNG